MEQVKIANHKIGKDCETYFIAEIGGNYTGFDEGKRIIDAGAKVGIHAMKFQTFEADTITIKENMFDMDSIGKVSQYDLFKELEPDKNVQREIIKYSTEKKISTYSAPSHINDLEIMAEFDMPAWKIGSDLATHIPLLEEVAKFNRPIILSTGMCTLKEVEQSLNAIAKYHEQIILLHCISDYPAKDVEQNLSVIPKMKDYFGVPVGFSDHTIGVEMSLAAIALGANAIERHFWCEGNTKGSDFILSSTPEEFEYLIKQSKRLQLALGDGIKQPTIHEQKNLKTNRISVVTLKDIKAGELFTMKNIDIRRPGYGIAPIHFYDIIGKKATINISAETPLKWEFIK